MIREIDQYNAAVPKLEENLEFIRKRASETVSLSPSSSLLLL